MAAAVAAESPERYAAPRNDNKQLEDAFILKYQRK